MNSPNAVFPKPIHLEDRNFSLIVQTFDNGCFISLSEDNMKIGSLVVSLSNKSNSVTTTVIPSKSESLFIKLIAERISAKIDGIAIVSLFLKKEIEPNTAKALMSEIIKLIEK